MSSNTNHGPNHIPSHYACITTASGDVTHVVVPIGDFERLQAEHQAMEATTAPAQSEIDAALRVLNDPATTWHDAGTVFEQLVRRGLAPLRKERGLTQTDLAAMLELSQAQVSRLERDLDGASLRLLRRIATLLKPDGNQLKAG